MVSTDSTGWSRQSLTWKTLHEPPNSVRKKQLLRAGKSFSSFSHASRCLCRATGSAAAAAASASKHNGSSLCPSAILLPSLWKLVLSSVPEISPLPPYLTNSPRSPSISRCDTQHTHTFYFPTSAVHPKPFHHAQRQFQNKASLTARPLPSCQGPASSPAPFSPMASCYRISLG